MIKRILMAIIVAVVAWLIVMAVALVLGLLEFSPAVAIGGFLDRFAVVIALLAGVWQFLTGRFSFPGG